MKQLLVRKSPNQLDWFLQVISLGFDMDKASAEVETLEREKAEKEAKEEEKRSTRSTRLIPSKM